VISASAFWYIVAFSGTVMLAMLFVGVLHLERIPTTWRVPVIVLGLAVFGAAVGTLLLPSYPR
jgi:hypothetical protein